MLSLYIFKLNIENKIFNSRFCLHSFPSKVEKLRWEKGEAIKFNISTI